MGSEMCIRDRVEVEAHRDDHNETLVVTVTDDGHGLTGNSVGSGLGTQIVQTLVKTELVGTVQWENREPPASGTIVRLTATKL